MAEQETSIAALGPQRSKMRGLMGVSAGVLHSLAVHARLAANFSLAYCKSVVG